MRFSASSLDCFQECPRKFKYKYIDREPDPTGDPAAIGRAVHAALEWWPNNCKHIEACDVLSGDNRLIARGMVRKVREVPWTVLSVEQKFKIETEKGEVVGALDGLVWHQGELYILERKTTSIDIDTFKSLKTFDRQTSLYYFGAMSLGHSPAGVILDIITRPKLRHSLSESDNEFEERIENAVVHDWAVLRKTDADLENNENELEQVIDLIQLGKYPRNAGACLKYGKLCPYFSKCQAG